MWLKLSIITLLFFILALVQNSFLSYVSMAGIVPGLVFILFFSVIFFEKNLTHSQGIFLALVAGFALDVFSPFYFGISMVMLMVIYFLYRIADHFLQENREGYSLWYFIVLFLISFSLYDVFWYSFSNFPRFSSAVSWQRLMTVFVCNLIVAVAVFYLYQYIGRFFKKDRQLTLFR